MYSINTTKSTPSVDATLKALRTEDKDLALNLRKIYTNIESATFDSIPTNSAELLSAYVGAIDITDVNASALLYSLEFDEISAVDVHTADAEVMHNIVEPAVQPSYLEMNAEQLTNVLFADLGTEITNEVVNLTTGLKVKLDMLDELKELLRTKFTDIRPEVLTSRLANALALTKDSKGSSLFTIDGNLAVYEFLNSDKKMDHKNYLFMADIEAPSTKCLDTLILESAFRSYKAQVALGTLPIPSKQLVLACTKAINGVKEVTSSNKAKVSNMTF
jgi:hypothetical protein